MQVLAAKEEVVQKSINLNIMEVLVAQAGVVQKEYARIQQGYIGSA